MLFSEHVTLHLTHSCPLLGGWLNLRDIHQCHTTSSLASFRASLKCSLPMEAFSTALSKIALFPHNSSSLPLLLSRALYSLRDFFLILIFLLCFIWLHWVLVTACGIQFPDQKSSLGPFHWRHGVLATDHQGSPERCFICLWSASLHGEKLKKVFLLFCLH